MEAASLHRKIEKVLRLLEDVEEHINSDSTLLDNDIGRNLLIASIRLQLWWSQKYKKVSLMCIVKVEHQMKMW